MGVVRRSNPYLEAELLAGLVLVDEFQVVPAGLDDLSKSQVMLTHETILLHICRVRMLIKVKFVTMTLHVRMLEYILV